MLILFEKKRLVIDRKMDDRKISCGKPAINLHAEQGAASFVQFAQLDAKSKLLYPVPAALCALCS